MPYLLPLKSELHSKEGRYLVKNETEFRLYNKYGTESEIQFDTATDAPRAAAGKSHQGRPGPARKESSRPPDLGHEQTSLARMVGRTLVRGRPPGRP